MQAEAPELVEEVPEGESEGMGDQIILDSQPEVDVEDLTGEMEYENLRYRTERERKRVKVCILLSLLTRITALAILCLA